MRRSRLTRSPLFPLLIAASILPVVPPSATGQTAVNPEHGLVVVAHILRGLGAVKRVLLIGAHPDDEDTALLTWLERGVGADAAYLSLSRGEGGQNLIGPELGVGLGLIRSEELLAARRLDGAEQYFTRAYDFGYSKSAEETFRLWPHDSLLADVVAVVRRFRPQVIVSIFSGTPRDRHGQHQAAGILAREAFDIAGDPDRFPAHRDRGLAPWTPLKLYRSTRFDRDETTLMIETGQFDALYGRSYHQIAMASRSQHRSQDMGRIEALGPQRTRLAFWESRVSGRGSDASILAGVDTTLAGLLAGARAGEDRRELERLLSEYVGSLQFARLTLGPWTDGRYVIPLLQKALRLLREARERAGQAGVSDLGWALGREERKLERALAETAGLILEAFADDDLVVPGQEVEVDVQIWNGGELPVEITGLSLHAPDGWEIVATERGDPDLPPDTLTVHRFRVRVPSDAAPSRPYFLRRPRRGAIYTWPAAETEVRGLPFDPPPVRARAEARIGDQWISLHTAAFFRFADQAIGEVRRPIRVVPRIGVSLAPETAVWPLDRRSREFVVRLRGEALNGTSGHVHLEVPPGWSVSPPTAAFRLRKPGSATALQFQVTAPADLRAGTYRVTAVARDELGRRYTQGYSVIDYPHIRRQLISADAVARVEAFELSLPHERRIGYIAGAGDAALEAIREMGLGVDNLDEAAVESGDLSAYDVLVLGIRAYETNEAVVTNNQRLLDWVRSGGTLIVQYQQYGYFRGDYAPYPLTAAFPHDRVTDESAAVRLLVTDHPAFTHPNTIGPADFTGWVQERGLYFPHTWDQRYRPLLETGDPGEAPKRGALLVAPVGKGLYVYTGLALFRQLPAGVPGAYRLLANLLALDR